MKKPLIRKEKRWSTRTRGYSNNSILCRWLPVTVRGNVLGSFFFIKTLLSSTKSGFYSTRSLQFNVSLDEDFRAVSVPAKLARKKQPRRLLGEHTELAVLSPQSSSKRPKNLQLPNTGQFSVFYVYTDGGGKVKVLHPHRSLFTSCSGRPFVSLYEKAIT